MSERYIRQSILPEVGPQGQQRLAQATVAVVGAGGLGCVVLPYLAAAGVGRLVIIDHDQVEESNLHRQPLFRMGDIGRPKVQAAREALLALNPLVRVDAHAEPLTAANAIHRALPAEVVIDAADSFAVTYILSDACARTRTPLVSASVLGLSGYVGAFCGTGPSYRAVFPDMPRVTGSCSQSGVLGTAVAVMGSLQAHLALGLLLRWEPGFLGRMLSVDLRTLHVGGFSFAGAREPPGPPIAFIAPAEVSVADIVIDLRSQEETPVSPFPSALRLGVDALETAQMRFPSEPRIVLCCRTGLRAWRAARALQSQGHRNVALIAMGE